MLCLHSTIGEQVLGMTRGVRSPPKSLKLAGTLPGVVGESEGLQAVKGEVGGQLVQAVVLQVHMFQCGHTQECII